MNAVEEQRLGNIFPSMHTPKISAMVSTAPAPRSQYVNDPTLRPFLSPDFDPIEYLNSTLPSLSISSTFQPTGTSQPQPQSLGELASQTQTHIAQLSGQTTRLTDTLTQLTDDILRSGSRLAYEVEILRGEATSLSEAMTENLRPQITKFLPEGIAVASTPPPTNGGHQQNQAKSEGVPPNANTIPNPSSPETPTDPPPITHLRTLHHVRALLQRVIQTFDNALSWPLPPSALSSSLISVSSSSSSSPAQSQQSLEEKGLAASRTLRDSVTDLLSRGDDEGLVAAEARVEELRDLVGVWKGTAEEKARVKFVEGLAKMVQDRRREREQQVRHEEGRVGLLGGGGTEVGKGRSSGEVGRTQSQSRGAAGGAGPESSGPGFLRNLQRLRDEIYLD
ncbi:hypothetical protein MMC06_000751 [Schaereria dolodes]|nr:hypothetical protein [Schaereria dolodes]